MIQVPTMKDKIAIIKYMTEVGWLQLGMVKQIGKTWLKIKDTYRHNKIMHRQRKQQYIDTIINKNINDSGRTLILFATIIQSKE